MKLRVIHVYTEDDLAWSFAFLIESPEELPEGVYFEYAPGDPADLPEELLV